MKRLMATGTVFGSDPGRYTGSIGLQAGKGVWEIRGEFFFGCLG